MRSGAGLVCVAVALALAGCGGGKKAPTTSSTAPITSSRPEAPTAEYTVHLVGASGLPSPASRATGRAAIGLYTSSETLCWTFSQLEHVTEPKKIFIKGYVRGTGFLSAPFGSYKAEGCRPNTPTIFLGLVKAHPHNFEVIISTKRPGGPLHAKL
jgi:hypothetical protein